MPPEDGSPPPADSPAAWLRYATADLAIARSPLPEGGLWETHTFHAQQAAEKAIKGALLQLGIEFPFTHDIDRLLRLVAAVPDVEVPDDVREAAELTPYAVASRYPGAEPEVTEDEYRRALAQAEVVINWATALVAGRTQGESIEP